MRREKTFIATTKDETEALALQWLRSRCGEITYSAPVTHNPWPIRKIQFEWEVVVSYDDEEDTNPR